MINKFRYLFNGIYHEVVKKNKICICRGGKSVQYKLSMIQNFSIKNKIHMCICTKHFWKERRETLYHYL